MKIWVLTFFMLWPFLFWSCSGPIPMEESYGPKENIIVNDLDWKENYDSRVAYLQIPKNSNLMSRCTGFLIGPSYLMTNNHCIPDQKTAQYLKTIFGYESQHTLFNKRKIHSFKCNKLVATNTELDFSILKCLHEPGALFGWTSLEEEKPQEGQTLYVIHQNCDYFNYKNCHPTKKKSPGRVLDSFDEYGPLINSDSFLLDADILQGSSGSPVFNQKTGKVMGILNVEYRPADYKNDGRGFMNGAVKMSSILNFLEEKFPDLREELREKGQDHIILSQDIKITGHYKFIEKDDLFSFYLKVMTEKDKISSIKAVHYHYKAGDIDRVVTSTEASRFFGKTFKVLSPHFSGQVQIELTNGNIISKEFSFLVEETDIFSKKKFNVKKIRLAYKFEYDHILNRYLYSMKVKTSKDMGVQIRRVRYRHGIFAKEKIRRSRRGFRARLVTPLREHPIQIIFELFDGKTYQKNVVLRAPKGLTRKKKNPFGFNDPMIRNDGLIQRVAVKKEFGFWLTYKFVIYLDMKKSLSNQVRRVDYIFENRVGGKKIVIPSWRKRSKFSTRVLRTRELGWKTLGARVILNNGQVFNLKGTIIK